MSIKDFLVLISGERERKDAGWHVLELRRLMCSELICLYSSRFGGSVLLVYELISSRLEGSVP